MRLVALFGGCLRHITRNLVLAHPAVLAAGIRLLDQANRIPSEIGSMAATRKAVVLAAVHASRQQRPTSLLIELRFATTGDYTQMPGAGN